MNTAPLDHDDDRDHESMPAPNSTPADHERANEPRAERRAELDSHEGADAFETAEQADDGARDAHAHSDAPRDDLPHINVDTPD
ncbi:hypothetical protein [Leucobacter japonicus]|uniref:hypothetical protein n=1 Tax=Leucobacter japonicus TaxID=1461259 RepID=UPI0006A7E3AE|nr:hypothetical protein [Leucobacter japonicus]